MKKIEIIMKELFFKVFKLNSTYPFNDSDYEKGFTFFSDSLALPNRLLTTNKEKEKILDQRKMYKVGQYYFECKSHAMELEKGYKRIRSNGSKLSKEGVLSKAVYPISYKRIVEVALPTSEAMTKYFALRNYEHLYKGAQRGVSDACWLTYVDYAALRDVYAMLRYAKYGIQYAVLSSSDTTPKMDPRHYQKPPTILHDSVYGIRMKIGNMLTREEMLSMADTLLKERLRESKWGTIILKYKDEVFAHAVDSADPIPEDLVTVIKHDLISGLEDAAGYQLARMIELKDNIITARKELFGE